MYLNTTSSFPSALGNQLVLSYSYDTAVASYTTAITALSLSLLTAGWLEPGCPPSSTLCLKKKQDTKLLPITSPNVNRFSKFFHW